VFDLETSESWSFPGGKRTPKALAFSPAGPMMAVSEAGKIALWGVGLTDKREELSASGPEAEAIAFSSNGLELGAGIGRQIVTWDMPTRRGSRTYSLSGRVRALAHAGDKGWVAVTDGGERNELRVWRVKEGRSMTSIKLAHPPVTIALSARGDRLAVGGNESEIYYWDTLGTSKD
jgi:WD40 repeat protein